MLLRSSNSLNLLMMYLPLMMVSFHFHFQEFDPPSLLPHSTPLSPSLSLRYIFEISELGQMTTEQLVQQIAKETKRLKSDLQLISELMGQTQVPINGKPEKRMQHTVCLCLSLLSCTNYKPKSGRGEVVSSHFNNILIMLPFMSCPPPFLLSLFSSSLINSPSLSNSC